MNNPTRTRTRTGRRLNQAPCNPLIIGKEHDYEGRYQITCASCGYIADTYALRLQDALTIAETHRK